MRKSKIFILLLTIGLIPESLVSAEELNLNLGASADFYYTYDLNKPNNGTAISNRNYDNQHNDFTLNLFQLNISASRKNLSLYAELDYGEFATQNADSGSALNLAQAYMSYNLSESLSLKAGKMYTHVGYEVAKAIDNWNYSRSFAFTLGGPFWHEGVALNYSKNSFGAGLYVYDRWDGRSDNNEGKTVGT